MTKIEQMFRKDPRVGGISDERGSDDGIWIDFHYGWVNCATETHCIHEDTWTECRRQLPNIIPCACEDCAKYRR